MLDADDLAGAADYLAASIERLVRAGAEVAVMAANTANIVFDEVQRRSAIPLLSIVQAACDRATSLGLRRMALLGTGFTMRGQFIRKCLREADWSWVTPADDEKAFIHEKTSASC